MNSYKNQNYYEPSNNKERKSIFDSAAFNISLKSVAGVALGLLVIIAYLGADAAISVANKKGELKDSHYEEEISDPFSRRTPELIKEKHGFFHYFFCQGNKRSTYCN